MSKREEVKRIINKLRSGKDLNFVPSQVHEQLLKSKLKADKPTINDKPKKD